MGLNGSADPEAVMRRRQTFAATIGFDLGRAALAQLQLQDAGVDPAKIELTGWCTREDPRWFSHRGQRPGRFLAAIVLP